MKTDTIILAETMRILAIEIHSDDGVANAAIQEAGERLEDLHSSNKKMRAAINNHCDDLTDLLSILEDSGMTLTADEFRKAISELKESII